MFDRLREVGVLQRDYASCRTKKDICDLCIPFRDKYKITDKQALMVAREELTLLEISNLLDAGTQHTADWISVKDRLPEPGGEDEK